MRSYIAVAFSSTCSLAGVDYEHFSLTQVSWYIALPHYYTIHVLRLASLPGLLNLQCIHSRILPLTSGDHSSSTWVKSVHYMWH